MISTLTIQSLTLGQGTDYSLHSAQGFESPAVQVSQSPLAGSHGSVIHRSLWRARRIRLEVGIRAATIAAYATLREALIQALDLPRNGNTTMEIITTDGKSLQMDVNIASMIDGGFRQGEITVGTMRIEMIAGDANIFGQTVNEQIIDPPVAGGITLPTEIPFALAITGGTETINNAGNGISFPIIRVNGPFTTANVRNSTIDAEMNITTSVSAAQYVEIDTLNQTVLLNGTTNYIAFFTGDFWVLQPGNNSIQFNTGDNNPASSCLVSWRSAYLGI